MGGEEGGFGGFWEEESKHFKGGGFGDFGMLAPSALPCSHSPPGFSPLLLLLLGGERV